jgi:hypothetical protein
MIGLRGYGRTLGSIAAFAVLLSVVLSADLMSAAGRNKYKIKDADIYLGDPDDIKKPAIVDVDAVYARIPEYREILEKNLDGTNARYLYLLRAASGRFRTSLDRCARLGGYDLIGGLGSISSEGVVIPNVTSKVIKSLP